MKHNRLCYISRNYYNLTSAGNKAKTDYERILDSMGATNIGLPCRVSSNKIQAFFYLRAGLPIIVWRQSAIAQLAEERNVGIVVNSLTELTEVLKSVTPADYKALKASVRQLAKEINNGENLKKAVNEALTDIK